MGSISNRPRIESEVVDASILGESIGLPVSGLVAPSRFLKAAMTERMSSWDQEDLAKRGIPSKELIRVYEEWSKGGYGIIVTGNAMLTPIDLETPGNAIIYRPTESPARLEAFQNLAKAAKALGSLAVLQINHPGRQTGTHLNPSPISPSDVQLADSLGQAFGKPRAVTAEDIEEVIDQFAYGAEFAYRTGFDGVQIHAAHGYLLAQFLAPTTNKRKDEYGGSLHNRARIIYRIVEEIKRRISDRRFSISIKINSAEFQQGGFQAEECRDVCHRLQELGLDWIELSGGTYEQLAFRHMKESTRAREAFFLEFAEIIRPALNIPIFVTGGWSTVEAMVKAIRDGSTDGIGLARPTCEEPYLAKQILAHVVHARVASKLDYDDTGAWIHFAGSQMRRLGFGLETADSTDENVVEAYLKELATFFAFVVEKRARGILVPGNPRFGTPNLPWELDY